MTASFQAGVAKEPVHWNASGSTTIELPLLWVTARARGSLRQLLFMRVITLGSWGSVRSVLSNHTPIRPAPAFAAGFTAPRG